MTPYEFLTVNGDLVFEPDKSTILATPMTEFNEKLFESYEKKLNYSFDVDMNYYI